VSNFICRYHAKVLDFRRDRVGRVRGGPEVPAR
jgi:hypothetical protein